MTPFSSSKTPRASALTPPDASSPPLYPSTLRLNPTPSLLALTSKYAHLHLPIWSRRVIDPTTPVSCRVPLSWDLTITIQRRAPTFRQTQAIVGSLGLVYDHARSSLLVVLSDHFLIPRHVLLPTSSLSSPPSHFLFITSVPSSMIGSILILKADCEIRPFFGLPDSLLTILYAHFLLVPVMVRGFSLQPQRLFDLLLSSSVNAILSSNASCCRVAFL